MEYSLSIHYLPATTLITTLAIPFAVSGYNKRDDEIKHIFDIISIENDTTLKNMYYIRLKFTKETGLFSCGYKLPT
jgi:hypothetical protein